MRSARLILALQSGALVLPAEGDIAVLRPRAGDDLTPFGTARVVVLTGFKPDHDHFAAKGYRVLGIAPYAAVMVCVPRARAEARAMVADAVGLAPGGVIIVDGQKTDGVDAILKECRAQGLQFGLSLSKAHGKLGAARASAVPADWAAAPRTVEGGFVTRPGVFSADGPDRGSQLLAAALPVELPARVGDLGAGWGYLSRAVLARPGVRHLDVVEAESAALDCARINLPDARAVFHWADATQFRPAQPWGAVVMNPPYHLSRTAEPNLGLQFIGAAQRGLAPDGTLWLVANRHLPYAPTLATLFRTIEEIGSDPVFRIIRARYPIRGR